MQYKVFQHLIYYFYSSWLYNICRGIDFEVVKPRSSSQSIGCCKKFAGRNKLIDIETLQHWLLELSTEIHERLEKDYTMNNRRANHMIVTMTFEINNKDVTSSRSRVLPSYEAKVIAKCCLDIIKQNMVPLFRPNSQKYLAYAIKYLGIITGKFISNANTNSIKVMFNNQVNKDKKVETIDSTINEKDENIVNMPSQLDDKNSDNLCNVSKEEESKSFFLQALKNIDNDTKVKRNSPSVKLENKNNIYSEKVRSCQKHLLDYLKPVTANDLLVENIKGWKPLNLLKSVHANTDETANKPSYSKSTNNTKAEKDFIKNGVAKENEENLLINDQTKKGKKNYRSQYVEFSLPTINAQLLKYIKCAVCGKNILDNETAIQTHNDYHYSLELNMQQHEEYRKQMKMKREDSSDNKGETKKIKLSNAKELKNADITKFFQKQNGNRK